MDIDAQQLPAMSLPSAGLVSYAETLCCNGTMLASARLGPAAAGPPQLSVMKRAFARLDAAGVGQAVATELLLTVLTVWVAGGEGVARRPDCVSALANIERSRSATVERNLDNETLNSCFQWRFNNNTTTTANDAGGMVVGTAANVTTAAECQMACRRRSDCGNFSFTRSAHDSGEKTHCRDNAIARFGELARSGLGWCVMEPT